MREDLNRIVAAGAIALAALALGGCSSTSMVGAAIGGAAGEIAGDGDPAITIGAAALGGLAGQAIENRAQSEFDQGYIIAQSDSIKRLNEARLAMQKQKREYDYAAEEVVADATQALAELEAEKELLETPPAPREELGKPVVYRVPGPTETSDGRKLVPHEIDLVVYE